MERVWTTETTGPRVKRQAGGRVVSEVWFLTVMPRLLTNSATKYAQTKYMHNQQQGYKAKEQGKQLP